MAVIGKSKRLELTQALRILVDLASKDSIDLLSGEVLKVSEKERTCDVLLSDDELKLEGVKLQTVGGSLIKGGLCLIPKVGSQITVAREDGALESAFVIATSELQKIIIEIGNSSLQIDAKGFEFNTGKKGGLTLTPKLLAKINTLEADLNVLKGLMATLAATGSAASTAPLLGATVAPFASWSAKVLTPTLITEIENPDIKQ